MTDKRAQSDKFKDLARELETNEDEAAFDRALKKIVTAKESLTDADHKGKPDGPPAKKDRPEDQ
jgi:hypothetical protein